MPDWLDRLKEQVAPYGKAIAAGLAPEMAQGYINTLFHQWEIDKKKVLHDVLNDCSLTDRATPEQLQRLASVADLLGNLDFITVELVIDSIRVDFPLVASLFLGWPQATEWLGRQLDDLKSRVLH